MGRISVHELDPSDADAIEAIGMLLPQLQGGGIRVDGYEGTLSASTSVIVAEDLEQRRIIGTLTLVIIELLTSRMARFEDVVVDDAARGQGVGRLLVEYGIERARLAGASVLDLVTQPERAAARRLYESAGFVARDIVALRLPLAPPT
jgi:GNAT superfamily N-acetyltransferase